MGYLPDQPRPISCYFCDRPASTMEAGYAVCEAMLHESQRRRIEAPAPPAHDDGQRAAPPEPTRYAEPGRCGFCGHFPENHKDHCVCGTCPCLGPDHEMARTALPEPPTALSDTLALDRIAALLESGADLDWSDSSEGVREIVASTGRVWDDPRFGDYGPSRGPS